MVVVGAFWGNPETKARVSKCSGRRCGPDPFPFHSTDNDRSGRTATPSPGVHRRNRFGLFRRVHLPVLPTSICSFVREKEEELRPRHVTDASVQASVGVHFVDRNILNKDPSIRIDDLSGFLMGEVGSLKSDPFMNLCHHLLFDPGSFRRAFFLKSQFPLGLRQPFGGAFQERRVFDGRSIGKRGKGFDPHIDPRRDAKTAGP